MTAEIRKDPNVSVSNEVESIIDRVRFELYRDNVVGARDLLQDAVVQFRHPRLTAMLENVNGWLRHLGTREGYIEAQEDQYFESRRKKGGRLKLLEKQFRILVGKKSRKMIRRRSRDPEFQLLEREILAGRHTRILDAGCGEGGVCLALGSRHPELQVVGVDVSESNVYLAKKLNRYSNVAFQQGLAEEVHLLFPLESFDLAYSFAVLEHVRDVQATVGSILKVIRPGGRFCFVVPMREIAARGPIPEYRPIHGYADHVRVFTEKELWGTFGGRPGFCLQKIPGQWKEGEMPDCFEPIEFGSFFVSFAKPSG